MDINYYLVNIRSIPQIIFAHSFHTDNYFYERLPQYNHIEISSIEQGIVNRIYSSGAGVSIPENSITVQFPSKDNLFTQTCDSYHGHNTIGFVCDHTITKIDKEKILELTDSGKNSLLWENGEGSPLYFIFPEILTPSDNVMKVRTLCKHAIQEFNTANPGLRQLAGIPYLFSIFKLLTDISYKQILEQQVPRHFVPANSLYAKQAMLYIDNHIDEKINVDDIADHLGISVGYLSNIFKEEMKQTLVKYINSAKMQKIMNLVQHKNMSFSQAGKIVGIEDPHYLSRLFKKLYGIPFREYMDHFKKFERHIGP